MDPAFIGMVRLATTCSPPDSSTHNCLQVSRTGDTLPLKIGTAVRDDDVGRSVGMVCLNITSVDARFLDLSQKMHGLVGMVCAQWQGSSKIGSAVPSATSVPTIEGQGRPIMLFIEFWRVGRGSRGGGVPRKGRLPPRARRRRCATRRTT